MDRLVALSDDLASAVERAGRTVLTVHGRPRLPSSGIHWRPGLVVTASHTVRAEEDITVTRPDGRPVPARLAGRDPALDVAVLTIEASELAVADIGDSAAVRVGHVVLAVGAGPRASWGVVSAIGAAPGAGESDVFSLDLTLYPGFSGGPLVDARGAVVGLTTSGASRHLHVAIPTTTVSRVVDDVVRHGRIRRPFLGVGTQPVQLPEAHGSGRRTAVIVVEVQPGSPAAGALLIGDVILSIDGKPIADPFDLRAVLRAAPIGQRVSVAVLRAGQARSVELVVGERPGGAR